MLCILTYASNGFKNQLNNYFLETFLFSNGCTNVIKTLPRRRYSVQNTLLNGIQYYSIM